MRKGRLWTILNPEGFRSRISPFDALDFQACRDRGPPFVSDGRHPCVVEVTISQVLILPIPDLLTFGVPAFNRTLANALHMLARMPSGGLSV